jgi:hypothetical protein
MANDIVKPDLTRLHNELVTNTAVLTPPHKEMVERAINQAFTLPEFKAKHFIGKAQMTPYAELKQYLIELNAREDLVEKLEYEYSKLYLQKELEIEKMDATESDAEKKLHLLEVMKYERSLKRQQNALYAAYQERELFLNLIDKFNNSPQGRLPDGRLIYDAVHEDPSVAEKLEKEYWTIRLAKQTAMDMIAYGRAGVGNMDAVMMLEQDQQEQVMQLASDLFVRNEVRTQQMLTAANKSLELGYEGTELTKLMGVEPKAREDVYLIQSSQQ